LEKSPVTSTVTLLQQDAHTIKLAQSEMERLTVGLAAAESEERELQELEPRGSSSHRNCRAARSWVSFEEGGYRKLGHGGEENESVPRLVEALAGKKVIGAAAGDHHTCTGVWRDAGEFFTLC
jgi:hypothetical protein